MGSGTETTVSTVMFYTKCRGVQYQPGLEASMKDKYYVTKQGRNFLIYIATEKFLLCKNSGCKHVQRENKCSFSECSHNNCHL